MSQTKNLLDKIGIEYVIFVEMYDSQGGSFKYALNPVTSLEKFEFERGERHLFISKWEYLNDQDMYYGEKKAFGLDYKRGVIKELTSEMIQKMKDAF